MGNKVHKSTRQRFVLFYVLMSFFHPQMLNTIAVLWHWCPSLKWLMQLWCWSFLLRWWLFCVCSLWGVVAIEVWPFFGHWSTVTMRCCGHMCTAVTIEAIWPLRYWDHLGVWAMEVLWPVRCCDHWGVVMCQCLYFSGGGHPRYPGPPSGGDEHDWDAGHRCPQPPARHHHLYDGPVRAVRAHRGGTST